ncbi:MAG: hypothetical protein GC161_10225 [Planctomycetaceae bacterium]|nr:hypothetical protein [Planctomycetaceae bacterium]
MKLTTPWIALAAALCTLVGSGVAGTPAGATGGALAASAELAQTQGWITRGQDNVCGLRDARQLSNPAKVDFPALLEETDEMKRLRKERIDPNSPQGIQLRDAARSKVANACEAIMQDQGHCSIWSSIRHSDGRAVTDVTDLVRQKM